MRVLLSSRANRLRRGEGRGIVPVTSERGDAALLVEDAHAGRRDVTIRFGPHQQFEGLA